MDVLSQILRPIEVRGSVFCHGQVQAPWCFRGGAEGACLFHAVVEGEAWIAVGQAEPRRLVAGDVVLLPRGGVHRMGSAAGLQAVPLGEALDHDGRAFARFDLGGEGAPSYLICGSFTIDGRDWHPLLRALPDVLIVNAGITAWLRSTLGALEKQLEAARLGSVLVASRLAEVLFVQVLAGWIEDRRDDEPDRWLRALRDPTIGRAIGFIHERPGQDWAAAELGRAVGMSRSALFTRFKELVGESPARYLARWRMTLAARALGVGDGSIQEIACRLGYRSVPSFTRAFRKHHGVTPGAWRRTHG